MSVCCLPHVDLEKTLSGIRSHILSHISNYDGPVRPNLLRVQSALALQCFTNEYIYDFTQKDEERLQALEDSAAAMLSYGKQPSPHIILCLASFQGIA